MPPEDPNYACNFDRFLEAITPKVTMKQLEETSIKDFFNSYKNASVFGLKVEFLNEQTLESELYTFIPTLSSLVLSYNKPDKDAANNQQEKQSKINRMLDFDGIEEIKGDPAAILECDVDGPAPVEDVVLLDVQPCS